MKLVDLQSEETRTEATEGSSPKRAAPTFILSTPSLQLLVQGQILPYTPSKLPVQLWKYYIHYLSGRHEINAEL